MSYQERKTIVSMISGIIILVAYCLYTFGRLQSGAADPGDLKFWAGAMLLFIGIGIVATIIIQIVFHILTSIAIAVQSKIRNQDMDDKQIEKSIDAEMIEDEMDKLINLKSLQVGFFFAGIGFVSGLLALLLDYSSAVALNIFYFSFNVGSVLEGAAQLYFYRRGV